VIVVEAEDVAIAQTRNVVTLQTVHYGGDLRSMLMIVDDFIRVDMLYRFVLEIIVQHMRGLYIVLSVCDRA
jgi:hypothetical protein